jgi:predicted  nucleic acid-binding Zn-ribbon protein
MSVRSILDEIQSIQGTIDSKNASIKKIDLTACSEAREAKSELERNNKTISSKMEEISKQMNANKQELATLKQKQESERRILASLTEVMNKFKE